MFDDAARVRGDPRVDDIGPRIMPGDHSAIRVLLHEARVAGNIGGEHRGQPALNRFVPHTFPWDREFKAILEEVEEVQ